MGSFPHSRGDMVGGKSGAIIQTPHQAGRKAYVG